MRYKMVFESEKDNLLNGQIAYLLSRAVGQIFLPNEVLNRFHHGGKDQVVNQFVHSKIFSRDHKVIRDSKHGSVRHYFSDPIWVFVSSNHPEILGYWEHLRSADEPLIMTIGEHAYRLVNAEQQEFFYEDRSGNSLMEISGITMSPVIFYDSMRVNDKQYKKCYSVFDQDPVVSKRITELFRSNIYKKVKATGMHLSKDMLNQCQLEVREGKARKVVVPYKGGYYDGFEGDFVLKAPANIAKMLWDLGIGPLGSSGFGMWDAVPKISDLVGA